MHRISLTAIALALLCQSVAPAADKASDVKPASHVRVVRSGGPYGEAKPAYFPAADVSAA